MAVIHRAAHNDNLADAIERIIDRGISVELWTRISLAGMESRSFYRAILIAPVETYLNYAKELALAGPHQGAARNRSNDHCVI